MFKNYLKITLRTIQRNRTYSSLNIIGLALGIAAFTFILQYVSYEKSYDKFHSNYNNIYRVQYQSFQQGELMINSAAAVPRIGAFIKENLPEVESFTRAYPVYGAMSSKKDKFRENRVFFTDQNFVSIFNFSALHGNVEDALSEPDKIVITESMAQKYFSRTDVVGEELTFSSWFNFKGEVAGVIKDVPKNSHIQFDFLISYPTLNKFNTDSDGTIGSEDSWDWDRFYTYILLKPGTQPAELESKIAFAIEKERGNYFRQNNKTDKFLLQPIADIHLYSHIDREADIEGQGDGQIVFYLTLIAVFILLISWVNYLNLSTARAIKRAKEVGVRKVVGASRLNLIYQFLTEAFVFNLLALAIGLLFTIVSIDLFNQMTGLALNNDYIVSSKLWIILLSVALIGAFLSGVYPAFILSSFIPSKVLKGQLKSSNDGLNFRKVLIIFQFSISICLIAGSIIVFKQIHFLKNSELGFNLSNVLVIRGPMVLDEESSISTLTSFKNDLSNNSQIQSVAASSNIPGDEIRWTNTIKRAGETDKELKNISFAGIDYDYFSTFGIKFLSGRNYSRSFTSDTGAVIINKAATALLGFKSTEEALNQKVILYGDPKVIIGVVDDYKQMSAKAIVSPLVFPLSEDSKNYIVIRSESEDFQSLLSATKNIFNEHFPENPFEYIILDQYFNRLYINEDQFLGVFAIFTILAIFIACLGLFGLSSFSALQRTKEIGIRKILGANVRGLLYLLNKEFLILTGIANIIALPITYIIMNEWLGNFATRISMEPLIFVTASIIAFFVTLLTVLIKTWRTTQSNPIDALRYE